MTHTSKTILFFGTEDFSTAALAALIEAGYDIAAVVTKPDARSGRGLKLQHHPVKALALEHNLSVWQPTDLRDIIPTIKDLQVTTGVLVSYGKIIPAEVLDAFEIGIVNVHPSLLPRYRGPTPIETAILNGDSATGVTLMKLFPAMDAGPIYEQKMYSIDESHNQLTLSDSLAQLGATMLLASLPSIMNGTLSPVPQDEGQATYTSLLNKKESALDPTVLTAEQAARKVRAHLLYPKTTYVIDEQPIIILQAHASDAPQGELSIACNDGRHLVIEQLVAPSGRTMNAADFERGYLQNRG
ncbi:MAG: fmt [Candidatus Saccharibacteria bacterium]|nr:fmt [Candidatus Saccharibacteria bacterium]